MNHNQYNTKFYRIVCSLCLIFFASICQAQFFKAAVIGTANFAQVDGDHIAGYNKLGLNAGIGITHDLNESTSVGFEILYAQKGSKLVNDPKAAVQPIYIIKSNYIDFPLVYTKKLQSIEQLTFHTGLSINAYLGGTIDDGITATDANFNPIELGFLLGSTYAFNDQLGFRVRHNYSLNKISTNLPNNSLRIFNRIGMFNRWFSVGLLYNLG